MFSPNKGKLTRRSPFGKTVHALPFHRRRASISESWITLSERKSWRTRSWLCSPWTSRFAAKVLSYQEISKVRSLVSPSSSGLLITLPWEITARLRPRWNKLYPVTENWMRPTKRKCSIFSGRLTSKWGNGTARRPHLNKRSLCNRRWLNITAVPLARGMQRSDSTRR